MNVFVKKSIESAEFLANRWPKQARVAVILGTGAGQVADRIEIDHAIDYRDIPNFPVSTAMGHAGRLILGELKNVPVVAMQGRFHLYEGYGLSQIAIPIYVMHRLGIETLIVTNASGGINPGFKSGDVMAIDSHIDLMNLTGSIYRNETAPGRPPRRIDSYDPQLIELAIAIGRRNNFAVHRGVYAAMLGPNYETRAEYRFLRRIGSDVVGMSTVPEVGVASQLGIRILGLSVVTNVADPDSLDPTSGQQVIDAAKIAEPRLTALISNAVSFLGGGDGGNTGLDQ